MGHPIRDSQRIPLKLECPGFQNAPRSLVLLQPIGPAVWASTSCTAGLATPSGFPHALHLHTPDCCPAELILLTRNVTVEGANKTAPDAPAASARPIKLNFNFVYRVLQLAPGVVLTFQDLEVAHYSYQPNTGPSFLALSPNGILVWQRCWEYWEVFINLNEYVVSSIHDHRHPEGSGAHHASIRVVDKATCQAQFAWPGACAEEGVLTGFHDMVVPFEEEKQWKRSDHASGGGFTWVLRDCYLTLGAEVDPACIRSKGFEDCFDDLGDAQQAREEGEIEAAAAAAADPSGLKGNAIIPGVVVAGVLLLCLAAALVFFVRRRRQRLQGAGSSFGATSEYSLVKVVEGSQYPSQLAPIEPNGAAASAGLPSSLKSGLAIGNLVGIGSFGMVHRGLLNGCAVALKLLMHNHPDTVPRVQQEVQITAGIHHENVAATYCCVELDRESLLATAKVSIGQIGWDRTSSAASPALAAYKSQRGSTSTAASPPTYVNVALIPRSRSEGAVLVEEGSNSRTQGSTGGSPTASNTCSSSTAAGVPRPMGVVTLVLEYCGGGSLLEAQQNGAFLTPCGSVDLTVLFPLLMDVACGMEALHRMLVCHGDLKCDNCMLSKIMGGPCTCSCHDDSVASPAATMRRGALPAAVPLSGYLSATAEVCRRQEPELGALAAIREGSSSSSTHSVQRHSQDLSAEVARGRGKAHAEGQPTVLTATTEIEDVEAGRAASLQQQQPAAAAGARPGGHGTTAGVGRIKPCCSRCRAVAKITDFGLVRAMAPLMTHHSTQTHGTVTHMAPEVLMEGHMRPAADVYSFGIMVYELVTGQKAWQGFTYPQIVRMVGIEGQRPSLPPALPQLLQRLIHSCWATNPEERHTFQQLVAYMTAAHSSGVISKMQQDMQAEMATVTGFF